MKVVKIPEKSIVVLCGVAGCGKSTFAAKNFKLTEIVSSDKCRAMVSDDESNMAVSRDAFEIFYMIIEKRMRTSRLVVADSTALSRDARKKLLKLARHYDYNTILIVLDVPIEVSMARNKERERKVPEKVIYKQYDAFKDSLKHIYSEGFDDIIMLKADDIDTFEVEISNLNADSLKYDQIGSISEPDSKSYFNSIYFKSRSGKKLKLESEETQEAINVIESMDVSPSMIVYVPPAIPSINNGSFEKQSDSISHYFERAGDFKLVIEARNFDREFVFIICKNSKTSIKVFGTNKIGAMYSYTSTVKLDKKLKSDILSKIQEDLSSSGYFEDYDTDFIVFEGILNNDNKVIPFKMICSSRASFYEKDNIWQLEAISKLYGYSDIFERHESVIVNDRMDVSHSLSKLCSKGYNELVVKHANAFPELHGEILQPEILCSSRRILSGEGYFNLSILSHELCASAADRFVDNGPCRRHLEYIIGIMALNNRILNIGVV